MRRIKWVPNPQRCDGGFLVVDEEGKPYLDGLGRPIQGAGLQLPPAIIDFQVPKVLGERLAVEWNRFVDETSTLEGMKELDPRHPIWCHPCRDFTEAKDLTKLECPKCHGTLTTSCVPFAHSTSKAPLLVNTVADRAIDGRLCFGQFHVPDYFHRWDMLRTLLSDGLVVRAEWNGHWQGMDYCAWHPSFDVFQEKDEVPQYYLAWQGNRIIFTKIGKIVTIKPGTFAPDWRSLQRLHPDSAFEVVYPNGDFER